MTVQFKKIITARQVRINGVDVIVDREANSIRDHLHSLLGPLGPVGDITIEVKTKPLTDSAGSPLLTRGSGS